jgi:hypothetical protein
MDNNVKSSATWVTECASCAPAENLTPEFAGEFLCARKCRFGRSAINFGEVGIVKDGNRALGRTIRAGHTATQFGRSNVRDL